MRAIRVGVVAAALTLGLAPVAVADEGPGVTRVSTAAGLQDAIDEAEPGDTIEMADGTYDNIVIANSGTAAEPITLTGSPDAIVDGGDNGSGYGVDLRADHWRLTGFTVRDAKKGVMATGASGNVLDGIEVYDIGEEGIHFRQESSDNVVRDSFVHDTGQVTEDYGEAIYLGSAQNHWDGGPDTSDRNRVLNNRLGPNVTAEHVDIKEGSTGGEVSGNTFDGTGQTGANSGESWVSAKGNGYLIAGNQGTAAYMSGYKTRVRVEGWGCGNVFRANTGSVAPYQADGWGFDVVNDGCAEPNVVCDDNEVTGATLGASTVVPTDCGDGQSPPAPELPVAGATASDHDGNVPANAIDGDLATRWSAEGDGVWLRLDLGSARPVGSLAVAWHRGDARVTTFDVQLSADGSVWTTALAGRRSSGATAGFESYDFAHGSARYVRLVGHGNTANDWTSVSEITVRGPRV
ncbi:discoidin domain-containing protein [Streptomyces litchfieldiae]|uniref:Discoidin domain-containing protein n=1 Tax=Streptomyces litchfieldiae TaxID=3075543 RepID=A0ABU2MMM6_9ACTN|nr:discoidin domain-containing protein [Streptomyces sp. DSM 44938]MDT0342860.1 discoidin domain-containing protein [Streptomyces sp. DSM 44938]